LPSSNPAKPFDKNRDFKRDRAMNQANAIKVNRNLTHHVKYEV